MNTQLIFFLLKLKNAAIYKKEIITVNYKEDFISVLNLLYKEGYIQSYNIECNKQKTKVIHIYLRYFNNIFALENLKLISKPSCIRTIKYKYLTYNIYDIRKTFFITTNKGLKTQLECKQQQLGGNLIFMC